MSRISRLQRASTPPRRRSRAWFARQEARRWVLVLDRVEYESGSCDCIDPWGRRTSYGWTAPRTVYYRWKEKRV